MRSENRRKSNYTNAGGRAFMTMLVNTIKWLANVKDEDWLRFSNLVINNIKNDWQLGYGIKREVLNTFNNLSQMSNFISKIKDMNNNGIDLNWVRSNLQMTNLMMALAHEQIDKTWSSRKLVIHDDWGQNSAMRYIDPNHIMNQPATADEYDYQ
tara:strand:+ start:698 stop:1159 length:462 start_codon:yes stop_codon:yes gene_type:complete